MGLCFICAAPGCHGREVGTTWRDAKRKRMWACNDHIAEIEARFIAATRIAPAERSLPKGEGIAPKKRRAQVPDSPSLFDHD